MRENLRRYYDQRAEMELQDKLMRQAAATLDYTPSEAELHEAVEQQIQTMEAQLAQRGLRLEDYCKFAGATPESLREDARADAEQALRMQKAVDRIAILEGLRASQKDLDDAMQVIARENGLSLDQLKGYCDDNFNRAVENSVLSTKAYAPRPRAGRRHRDHRRRPKISIDNFHNRQLVSSCRLCDLQLQILVVVYSF